MPPYTLLTDASEAASRKDLKERTGKLYSNSDESVKATPSPNKCVSISAAVDDTVLCPEVYSGNGGLWMKEVHFSSNKR